MGKYRLGLTKGHNGLWITPRPYEEKMSLSDKKAIRMYFSLTLQNQVED
jgi:hypothetical protein